MSAGWAILLSQLLLLVLAPGWPTAPLNLSHPLWRPSTSSSLAGDDSLQDQNGLVHLFPLFAEFDEHLVNVHTAQVYPDFAHAIGRASLADSMLGYSRLRKRLFSARFLGLFPRPSSHARSFRSRSDESWLAPSPPPGEAFRS